MIVCLEDIVNSNIMYDSIKKDYFTKGYSIIRNAIDESLAIEIKEDVYWLAKKYPDIHPEAFHHELLVNDPFIHHLLKSENLLEIASLFYSEGLPASSFSTELE